MCSMAFAPVAQAATILKVGSRGSDVLTLQGELSNLGYSVGTLDGIYGPKTLAAVEAFQQSDHLQVDGIDGPLTQAALEKTSGKVVSYSNTDTNLLARVVNGEARGESYSGQVAVAAVVLNRVADPVFPNTIAGVIYQPGAFTSVSDGQINLTPSASAISAAKEAESGVDPTGGALYFFNPAKTTNKFLWSQPETTQIGNQIFAK
nr:spore cortex-lytic enzyme [Desulfosporosinus acidiphilus]